jgi:hypothetical protein
MLPSRRLGAVTVAVAVVLPLAASVSALPIGRSTRHAPAVQSMIVGMNGVTLFAAGTVRASPTTVKVGRRRCAAAAGTPLAVLAAMRRAGGPAFAVRDYGHCGGAAVNSAELFVYSLGGEANSGQNGWEYKVDGTAGSTGGGDPSGPSGNGRLLQSGERVLWFWCVAVGGGCERTLEVATSTSRVSPGGSLGVTVRGYDDEGRSVPVAGATVALGLDSASTGAGGRATVNAPVTPGSYPVSASRQGLVPSFPETIVVR